MSASGVRARMERTETLLAAVDALDEPARSTALDAVQAVVELYGDALGRLLAGARAHGGPDAPAAVAADPLVAQLLVVHGIHPVPVEVRIERALDEVRPALRAHGGGVALVGVDGGVVRVRLDGTCNGCPSSATTMRLAVEEAIRRAAPEVERIEAEGERAPGPATSPALVCPTVAA